MSSKTFRTQWNTFLQFFKNMLILNDLFKQFGPCSGPTTPGVWFSIHTVWNPASCLAENGLICMGWLELCWHQDFINFTNCPRTFAGHCIIHSSHSGSSVNLNNRILLNYFNSWPARGKFWRSLMTYAKQFGSRWSPTKYGASSEILIVWHSDYISAKYLGGNNDFLHLLKEKNIWKNYPACKEFKMWISNRADPAQKAPVGGL